MRTYTSRYGRFLAFAICTFVFCSCIFCIGAARSAIAADLTVRVIGLGSNTGDVHIALYNTPESFPKGKFMLTEARPDVSKSQAEWTFRDLTPGQYAIATYHDANENDDFDQGFLGIPLEDYGFSSGAQAFLGPPSFEDAAFELPDRGLTMTIDLGNDPKQ